MRYFIGIDTGKHTGVCVWDAEERWIVLVATTLIHRAFDIVSQYPKGDTLVRVEDARQRKWFGRGDQSFKAQGAGSVKRDAVIWEDFLRDRGYRFQMVAPRDNRTKLTRTEFESMTKLRTSTSEHSRDAAMLVFGLGRNFLA